MNPGKYGDTAILYLYMWIQRQIDRGSTTEDVARALMFLRDQSGVSTHHFMDMRPLDSLPADQRRDMRKRAVVLVRHMAQEKPIVFRGLRKKVETKALEIGVTPEEALAFVRELLHELINQELRDSE